MPGVDMDLSLTLSAVQCYSGYEDGKISKQYKFYKYKIEIDFGQRHLYSVFKAGEAQ